MDGEEYAYERVLHKRILNLKSWEKLVEEVIAVEPDETQLELNGKRKYLVFALWNDGQRIVHPHDTFQLRCPQKVS
jgi:hypothetical protein